jgi:MFS family permease
VATNSLSIWGAAFFARVHGLDLQLIGWLAGMLSLVAGVPATILGGVVADRLRRRWGRGGRMHFGALAALASAPLWVVLLFSHNWALLLLANAVLLGVSLMWVGAATADVHDIAGPQLRGLAIGAFFFCVNIAAYGLGAPLVGRLNDLLGVSADPAMMRYALLLCPAVSALAALLLWRGSRLLSRQDEANGEELKK